jgi:hypothetical protein
MTEQEDTDEVGMNRRKGWKKDECLFGVVRKEEENLLDYEEGGTHRSLSRPSA